MRSCTVILQTLLMLFHLVTTTQATTVHKISKADFHGRSILSITKPGQYYLVLLDERLPEEPIVQKSFRAVR